MQATNYSTWITKCQGQVLQHQPQTNMNEIWVTQCSRNVTCAEQGKLMYPPDSCTTWGSTVMNYSLKTSTTLRHLRHLLWLYDYLLNKTLFWIFLDCMYHSSWSTGSDFWKFRAFLPLSLVLWFYYDIKILDGNVMHLTGQLSFSNECFLLGLSFYFLQLFNWGVLTPRAVCRVRSKWWTKLNDDK